MDPNQPTNSGSFMGPAGGGGSAIARAMARRGMGGGGVLNQAGPGSPAGANSVLPPAPPPAPENAMPMQGGGQPQQMPVPPMPQAQSSVIPGMGIPQGEPQMDPEREMIIKALVDQLESQNKIQEAQSGILG